MRKKFAFIIFFGKYGTLNLLLMETGLIKTPINLIYGLHELVFIQSLHMLPFIVLSLSAGFTNRDPCFEEAAEVEGASGFRRFLTVTLPLCTPSHLAGAVIVFLWPFTDWLTPLILGKVDFLPSVAYIDIAYHSTNVHCKWMGIAAWNKGEILTLLAPSGCGKTTTLRCIAGLEKPEGGHRD